MSATPNFAQILLTQMYRFPVFLGAIVLALSGLPGLVSGQSVGSCEPAMGEGMLEVNNVRARILNNGGQFWRGSPHVYEVPKGGVANAIFASGIWLGGTIDGALHFAGSTYGPYEFWAGPLPDDGSPPVNCQRWDRVWSVTLDEVEVYERFGVVTADLVDWPTGLGAPTLDRFGAPINLLGLPLSLRADRKIDLESGERPDITGDQMLWWIMNDRGGPHERSQSAPLGVEIHGSAFAFSSAGALGNTTFYRLRISKPTGAPLEDAYLGLFQDPDMGNFADDFVGSDSMLSMGYVYNADNNEEGGEGYGQAPPAVGTDLFQGPRIAADGRDNDRDGVIDEAGERMSLTAFMHYTGGGGLRGDPISGAEMYNYTRGRWKNGQPQVWGGYGWDYSTELASFAFPGDPPAAWSEFNRGDGTSNSPSDRRFVASTGPFRIVPGEPQEIVYGIVTSFGEDNLDSVQKLKRDDAFIQNLVDEGLFERPAPTLVAPEKFELAASVYPVPAADQLTIRYSLPQEMAVSIRVFDALGRLRTTAVQSMRAAGDYTTAIDVSDWRPGAYLARIQMDHHVASRRIVVSR